MRKGGAGTIILILIIAVIGIAVFYFLSRKPPTDQTQPDQTQPRYKNDVITVESISISNPEPYSNGITTLSFLVRNNGEFPADVKIDFFSIPGFVFKSLYCDLVPTNERKCEFSGDNSIEPLSYREVSLTLQAPNVSSPTSFTISYYIEYNYSGFRKMDIPIVDGITRKEPLGKFEQSKPTYGPVLLEFEPPIGAERKEDNRIIREYWARQNEPFLVKMRFRHIGSGSVGNILPVNISKEKIRFNISEIEIAQNLPCDFDEYIKPRKDVLVPKDLMCHFISTTDQPEVTGTIYAEFNYTYRYIRTETLKVKPLTV
ncbi:MAG: hypothetical protein QMD12_02750 [Candidatus Aenigmarchaeota archaeon]|nr:hypothetical protein [Candidatus Aenigmarchaeota archaeon]